MKAVADLVHSMYIALMADTDLRTIVSSQPPEDTRKFEWPEGFLESHAVPDDLNFTGYLSWSIMVSRDGEVWYLPSVGPNGHADPEQQLLKELGIEPRRVGNLREPIVQFLPAWAIENGVYVHDSYQACEIDITSQWAYASEVRAYRERLIKELQAT